MAGCFCQLNHQETNSIQTYCILAGSFCSVLHCPPVIQKIRASSFGRCRKFGHKPLMSGFSVFATYLKWIHSHAVSRTYPAQNFEHPDTITLTPKNLAVGKCDFTARLANSLIALILYHFVLREHVRAAGRAQPNAVTVVRRDRGDWHA